MRTPWFGVVPCLFLSLTASAQEFPATVELSRRVDALVDGTRTDALAVDAAGNVYLAGLTPFGAPAGSARIGPLGGADIFVIKLNAAGDPIYRVTIGGAFDDFVKAMRVDAAGNVYLLGTTQSSDFPFTTRLVPENPVGGLALKLNAAGTALAYAAQLGARVSPLAFDLDATGNAYIVGLAPSRDLPSTPGVLNPSPAAGVDASVFLGFVARLNAAGTALDLATYFGPQSDWMEAVAVRPGGILVLGAGNLALLNPGLSQVISQTTAGIKPGSLAFDGAGNIYVSGMAQSGAGFVIKKYASASGQPVLEKPLPQLNSATPARLAVTTTGRMYLFGVPTSAGFETRNATQPCLANIAAPGGTAGVLGPSLDGGLIGTTGGGNTPGDQALVILDTDGSLLHSTFFSTAVRQVAVAPSNGRIYGAGIQTIWTTPRATWRGIVRFNQDLIPPTRTSPSCVVHGATFTVVPLSPGAIMTVFGSHLGPAAGTVFSLDQNGRVGTSLGGVTMTVAGRPAVLLYVQDRQINFIVPWSTPSSGSVVPVCVNYDGVNSCVSVATAALTPGVFARGAGSAALNQDGTVNEPGSPAPRGSIVALFMTGTGLMGGELIDGGVAGAVLQHVNAEVSAIYSPSAGGCTLFSCPNFPGSTNVPVHFAGAAPGLVLGVTQINLQIPGDMPPGDNQIFILRFRLPGIAEPVIAQARLSVR
jgi:uncharacterized protein (TIGR03437 family)